MIKLLIADDNHYKLKEIQEKVLDQLDINDLEVIVVTDIVNAKRELKDQQFDLFIVDIQLPLRFQDTPKPQGGLELIKELQISTRYNVPLNIIGLTEFDASLQSVSTEFDLHLYSLIKFDRTTDEWVHQLKNHISHIVRAKVSTNETEISYEFDLAIICALEGVELRSLFNLPIKWEETIYDADNSRYFTGVFKRGDKEVKVVICASGQMGMVAASVLSMKVIDHFRPKYLAMSGIMAGVRGEVNIGDIVIADTSWDYGSGKFILNEKEEMEFLPDPLPIRLETDLKTKINRFCSNDVLLQQIKFDWPANKPESSLKATLGAVATGSAVLSNKKVVERILKQNRNLLGIEMEAYGVLYAATHATKPRPKVFVAKSVCDFADEQKNDQYQDYAAYTSAKFIYQLALNYLDFEE